MKKSCFGLVFLVLLTLFKGVEAGHNENGPLLAVFWYILLPILVGSVIVFFSCLYTYCLLKRQRRKNRRRRHSFIHSRPSQRPACNTSHARVSGAGCLPNTRERQPTTANPLETLTVRLPPLHSGEQPSLPFNVEETPSPYSREEPPPPYSGEGPSSSPSREEPPPPYSGEEPLSQYAETSLV
ncbi:uncharacterized protein LOC144654431 isoform X2 [Oculina patagonica]